MVTIYARFANWKIETDPFVATAKTVQILMA